MKDNVRNLLKEVKNGLKSIYGENLCGFYLFGSHASESEESGSDVDVAIILKDFHRYSAEIERTSHLISELSLKYDVSVSRVVLREHQWKEDDFPFFINLRRDGIPV